MIGVIITSDSFAGVDSWHEGDVISSSIDVTAISALSHVLVWLLLVEVFRYFIS